MPSRLKRLRARHWALVCLVASTAGCNSGKYHVAEDDQTQNDQPTGVGGARTGRAVNTAGAAGESPSMDGSSIRGDADAERLVAAFALGDATCAEAIFQDCTTPVLNCATSTACVDYGECVRDRASPTAETTCTDDLGTSLNDRWQYELVRHCFATRYAECRFGDDFACVGKYGPPSTDRKEVSIGQQITVMNWAGDDQDPVSPKELTVSFCPKWTDCETRELAVDPDQQGFYGVTLEVGNGTSGIGNDWQGYRKVEGPALYPSVIEANVPVWGSRVEVTRLLDSFTIDKLSLIYQADSKDALFIQVVDCRSDPAADVILEMPTSTAAKVVYVNDRQVPSNTSSTTPTGAAGIYGHTPNQLHQVRALRNGSTVGTYSGYLEAGLPRYIRLHPLGAGQ